MPAARCKEGRAHKAEHRVAQVTKVESYEHDIDKHLCFGECGSEVSKGKIRHRA